MLETLAKVFGRVRESKMLFRESFARVGYYNHYVKGCHPVAAGGPAGEGHQRMRVAVAKFLKVRLCETQTRRLLIRDSLS